MKESKLRWVSLISGGGTTMENMAKACLPGGQLHGLVEPVGVISSRQNSGGIAKAETLGIPVAVVPRKDFTQNEAGTEKYGELLLAALRRFAPDIVTLNGFLARVSPAVLEAYRKKFYNQHPGPVPEFGGEGMYGRRVHAAVLIFNRLALREHPQTFVIAQEAAPQYDQGNIVGRIPVAITKSDTVEDLAARALPYEHRLQIELLEQAANSRVAPVPVEPFIKPGESITLYLAREAGKALYPNG